MLHSIKRSYIECLHQQLEISAVLLSFVWSKLQSIYLEGLRRDNGYCAICSLDSRCKYSPFLLVYIVLRDYLSRQLEHVSASNPNASSSTRRLSADSVPAPRPTPPIFSCSLYGLESLTSSIEFLRIYKSALHYSSSISAEFF